MGCRFGVPSSASHGFGVTAQAWDTGTVHDPEIAQCLKRLSKSDVSTKIKALRNLTNIVSAGSPDHAADLIPSWNFVFKRIIMDTNRSVRHASVQAFDAIAMTCGRKIAPHLKGVMGPWWFAMSDPFKEASAAALAVFEV
jgi:E3 ubiquitin-protein ligase listerin